MDDPTGTGQLPTEEIDAVEATPAEEAVPASEEVPVAVAAEQESEEPETESPEQAGPEAASEDDAEPDAETGTEPESAAQEAEPEESAAAGAEEPPSGEAEVPAEEPEAPAEEPEAPAEEPEAPAEETATPTAESAEPPAKKRKGKKELPDIDEERFAPETQILVLKTQVGQERRVAENLANKARRFGLPVLSLLAPQELRGYVFIETSDPVRVDKGIRGVSYARALIKDPDGQPRDTPFTEIQHFLTPVSAVAKIAEGDIVELVSGPFRGEKAKVTRVDDAREEITVELIESMVPIPITVKGEHVRVLQKGKA